MNKQVHWSHCVDGKGITVQLVFIVLYALPSPLVIQKAEKVLNFLDQSSWQASGAATARSKS